MDNQNQPQIVNHLLNEEDKHIEQLKKKSGKRFLNSPKFQQWYKHFYDKGNKETFGNATRSAMLAYNLDPVKQYSVASSIGSENLKKLDNAGKELLEKKGVTYSTFMDIGFNKMLKSNNPDLWYAFAEMLKYPVPQYKPVTNATFIQNQTNNQFNAGAMSVKMIQDDDENAQVEGQDFTFDGETKDNAIESVEVKEENGATNQTDTSPVPDSDGQDTV